MDLPLRERIESVCRQYDRRRDRLMDMAIDIQAAERCISPEAQDALARELGMEVVDVQSLVTFYAFLTESPTGRVVVRLCDDIPDFLAGLDAVAEALSSELGLEFGQTSPDGQITLERTPCIGMSDQCPAALVNEVVVTNLTPESARAMARGLLRHGDPHRLVEHTGDGRNSHELIRAMVQNNLRERGPVLFGGPVTGRGLEAALRKPSAEVRAQVRASNLRGRGGAGFPTGQKWDFAAKAEGTRRTVICNADEGEPGTFKDRVLLTELPELMFEGMTIDAYAIGADEGILYLRGEYTYLRPFLEHVLGLRRRSGLLGRNILGHSGFDFDIRIQRGAGAYVCGEESALISSCEGLRGDPKTRPPYPAQSGYLGRPTVVNNVETLCAAARILEHGADWFAAIGEPQSTGTKLLSVSGHCERPGVYEVPNGLTLSDLLERVGAKQVQAVQVGGFSGHLIPPREFGRRISNTDLLTGGAVLVLGEGVDLIAMGVRVLEFFVEESCGFCTPCRAGNVLLLERMKRVAAGHGEEADYTYLAELSEAIKGTSRCGFGQTSPNVVLDLLRHFRPVLEKSIGIDPGNGTREAFDLGAALRDAERISGRRSTHHLAERTEHREAAPRKEVKIDGQTRQDTPKEGER